MSDDRQKSRTTVKIYDEKYTIVGYEDPQHIRKVARYVDEKMREIKETNPFLDTKKLAVLTAVNAVNEYMKLQNKQSEQLQKENEEDE